MLWWFTEATLVAGVLALAAGLAARFRLFRIGPAARHALWVVVLLKLLTPPLVSAPWAVRVGAPTPARGGAAEGSTIDPKVLDLALVTNDAGTDVAGPDALEADVTEVALGLPDVSDLLFVDATEAAPVQGLVIEGPAAAATAAWRSRIDSDVAGRWLLWTWVAATAIVALVQTARIVRFARRLRSGKPAPAWIVEETERLAERMGVRVPRALVVPGLGVPMLWCLGRPVLLLPEHLVESLDADRWRGVLAHELAHLRRGDPWFGRLALVAGLVWWWNPLFWLVRRRLEAEAELACDAWVVWTLPDDRLTYARTMLEICESLCRTAAPPLAPALGGNDSGRFFERRLNMILNDRVPCRLSWPGLIAPGLLVLIGLPSWTVASAVADDGPKTVEESKIIVFTPAEKDGETAEVRLEAARTVGGGKLIEVRLPDDSPDGEANLREKARAAHEKARTHLEEVRAETRAWIQRARAAVEKAEAELARVEQGPEDEPARAHARKQLEEARAQLGKAEMAAHSAATAKAEVRVEVRSDDADGPPRGRREIRRRFEVRRAQPRPERELKDDDKARDQDKDKGEAKDEDKDADDKDVEIEIEVRDLSKVFGPDSELMKHLRSLGPTIEKKLREKIGPGTELDEKLKGLSGRLDKELRENLGPGSDFDKAMKDLSKALEEQFGPGSDFDKQIREFSGKLEERPRERGERDREREGEARERDRGQERERPRAESRPREESPRPEGRAMEHYEAYSERARAAAREARRRGLEAQIKALREQLERLEREEKAGEKPSR